MLRIISSACAVAACGLLAWAASSALHPAADEPRPTATEGGGTPGSGPHEHGLVIEDAEQDLGRRPVGEYPVTVRVTNLSDRPGEIVGYPGSCGGSCCFFVREPGRRTVPPGESIEIVGELDIRRPGPFEFEGNLFLNDNGRLRIVPIRLSGVGLSGEKPNAPPP